MSPVNPGSREPFTRYFLQSFPTFSSVYPSQPSLIFPRSNLFSLLSVQTFSPFYPYRPSLLLSTPTLSPSIRRDLHFLYPTQPSLLLSASQLSLLLSIPTLYSSVRLNLFLFYPSQPLFWLTLFLLPSLFYTIPVFLPGRSWLTLFSS